SIRAMAEMLGVDSKTVKNYLSAGGKKEKIKNKVNSPMLQQYRTQLLEGIQQFPDDSRTQIRERFKREYMYLYRHDKKWLFNNIRAMAEMLGVDSKTVKNYLSAGGKKEKIKNKVNSPMLQQYRTQLLEGIQQFPDDSRTQIRERFKREYMYLYRHDKKWLFNNLPINQIKGKPKATVDWESRDCEYYSKIKRLYEEL